VYQLTVEDHFSSAHQLRGYKGKCENLHGHNWHVMVTVKGEKLNQIGLLIDFHELKKSLKETLSQIDHCNINETDYFKEINPSSEHLARFIYNEMERHLADKNEVEMESVTVFESETSRCRYKK
jgi:6-pyruvoyltetrahydropterin/6-carboxytetrahydropterin synthase